MAELPPIPPQDDNLPPDSPATSGQAPASTPAKPRKRRWLRWVGGIVAVLILVVVLLVVFAPAIASTAPVRAFVLGQVNQSLNGHVEIADWSLGWRGPIQIKGVRVFDDQNRVILELRQLTTQLGLFKALRGDYALGQTTVDGLNLVKCDIDADGTTNYQKLTKSNPKSPQSSQPTPSSPKPLPQVSGNIKVTDLRGTITAVGAPAPLYIDSSHATVVIPSINDPIQNDMDLALRVGNGKTGHVKLGGTVDAVDNRRIDPQKLTADETVQLAQADVGALSPLLRMVKLELSTAGVADGSIHLKAASANDVRADGAIKVADFQATGGLLQGDTFHTTALNIPIDATISSPDSQTTLINIKTLRLEMDQGAIAVTANAPLQALQAVGRLIPAAIDQSLGRGSTTQTIAWSGGTGQAAVTADFPKLADLIRQLPHLLKLQQGVSVTSAALHHNTTLNLTADHAALASSTDLTDVAGTNGGKPITLQPVHLSAGATAIPTPRPDLHDLKMSLTSGFATISGGGPSLANLKLDGGFNLKDLQAQAEQFVNLTALLKATQTVQLAGTGKFDLSTNGNLTQSDAPVALKANLTLNNMQVAGLTAAPFTEPWLALGAQGTLHRAGDGPQGVPDATLTLQSGDPAHPTVDLLATANLLLQPSLTAPALKLVRLNVPNLPRAQQEFAAFLPKDLLFQAGSLAATAGGSYDGRSIKLDQPLDLTASHLTVVQTGQTGQTPLLQDETLTATLTGIIDLGGGATQQARDIAAKLNSSFATLTLSDGQFLLKRGAGAQPVSLWDKMQKLALRAEVPNLPRLQGVLNAFSAPADQSGSKPLKLTGGSLLAVLNIARDNQLTTVDVSQLSAQKIAFTRGPGQFSTDAADFKLTAAIDAASEAGNTGESLMRQIKSIKITALSGNIGAGDDALAKLSMTEPITLASLADHPTAAGAIQVSGSIARVAALLDAWQGNKPGTGLPYRGGYALNQTIATQANNITLNGTLQASQFKVMGTDATGAQAVVFSEDQLDVSNNLLLDPQAHDATINNLAVSMKSSGALALQATGKLLDWQTQRKLDNVKLTLKYDLAKLTPIAKPLLLTPEQRQQYAQLDMAGQFEKTFTLSGSYPANLPFNEAVKHLVADGGLAVGTFKLPEKGIEVQNLDLPIHLADGKLVTLDLSKPQGQQTPAPAAFNSGQLNLGNLTLDLSQEHPRLTVPDDHALVTNATLNPVFAQSVLNDFLNNPLFADTKQSKGLISITLLKCQQFPLDSYMKNPRNDGVLSLKYSITGLEIGNELVTNLVGYLAPEAFNENSLQGAIKDGTITIRNGVVSQSTPLSVDKYTLDLSGNVDLASKQLQPMNLTIPTALFRQKELASALPQLVIPLTGTASKPKLDIGGVIQQNLAKGLLGNLLNPDKNKPATTAPNGAAQPQKDNPLGDLLDALGGKKDQDKDQPKKKDNGSKKKKK